MCDIWSCFTNVPIHLAHDPNMLVTVQERVLFILDNTATTTMRGFVGFETRIGEDNNQPLGIFVGGCYGRVLFGHKLWKFWWGAGLGGPYLTSRRSA